MPNTKNLEDIDLADLFDAAKQLIEGKKLPKNVQNNLITLYDSFSSTLDTVQKTLKEMGVDDGFSLGSLNIGTLLSLYDVYRRFMNGDTSVLNDLNKENGVAEILKNARKSSAAKEVGSWEMSKKEISDMLSEESMELLADKYQQERLEREEKAQKIENEEKEKENESAAEDQKEAEKDKINKEEEIKEKTEDLREEQDQKEQEQKEQEQNQKEESASEKEEKTQDELSAEKQDELGEELNEEEDVLDDRKEEPEIEKAETVPEPEKRETEEERKNKKLDVDVPEEDEEPKIDEKEKREPEHRGLNPAEEGPDSKNQDDEEKEPEKEDTRRREEKRREEEEETQRQAENGEEPEDAELEEEEPDEKNELDAEEINELEDDGVEEEKDRFEDFEKEEPDEKNELDAEEINELEDDGVEEEKDRFEDFEKEEPDEKNELDAEEINELEDDGVEEEKDRLEDFEKEEPDELGENEEELNFDIGQEFGNEVEEGAEELGNMEEELREEPQQAVQEETEEKETEGPSIEGTLAYIREAFPTRNDKGEAEPSVVTDVMRDNITKLFNRFDEAKDNISSMMDAKKDGNEGVTMGAENVGALYARTALLNKLAYGEDQERQTVLDGLNQEGFADHLINSMSAAFENFANTPQNQSMVKDSFLNLQGLNDMVQGDVSRFSAEDQQKLWQPQTKPQAQPKQETPETQMTGQTKENTMLFIQNRFGQENITEAVQENIEKLFSGAEKAFDALGAGIDSLGPEKKRFTLGPENAGNLFAMSSVLQRLNDFDDNSILSDLQKPGMAEKLQNQAKNTDAAQKIGGEEHSLKYFQKYIMDDGALQDLGDAFNVALKQKAEPQKDTAAAQTESPEKETSPLESILEQPKPESTPAAKQEEKKPEEKEADGDAQLQNNLLSLVQDKFGKDAVTDTVKENVTKIFNNFALAADTLLASIDSVEGTDQKIAFGAENVGSILSMFSMERRLSKGDQSVLKELQTPGMADNLQKLAAGSDLAKNLGNQERTPEDLTQLFMNEKSIDDLTSQFSLVQQKDKPDAPTKEEAKEEKKQDTPTKEEAKEEKKQDTPEKDSEKKTLREELYLDADGKPIKFKKDSTPEEKQEQLKKMLKKGKTVFKVSTDSMEPTLLSYDKAHDMIEETPAPTKEPGNLPEEPGFIDRIKDFFLSFIGKRDEKCVAYDNAVEEKEKYERANQIRAAIRKRVKENAEEAEKEKENPEKEKENPEKEKENPEKEKENPEKEKKKAEKEAKKNKGVKTPEKTTEKTTEKTVEKKQAVPAKQEVKKEVPKVLITPETEERTKQENEKELQGIFKSIAEKFGEDMLSDELKENVRTLQNGNTDTIRALLEGSEQEELTLGAELAGNAIAFSRLKAGIEKDDFNLMNDLQTPGMGEKIRKHSALSSQAKYFGDRNHKTMDLVEHLVVDEGIQKVSADAEKDLNDRTKNLIGERKYKEVQDAREKNNVRMKEDFLKKKETAAQNKAEVPLTAEKSAPPENANFVSGNLYQVKGSSELHMASGNSEVVKADNAGLTAAQKQQRVKEQNEAAKRKFLRAPGTQVSGTMYRAAGDLDWKMIPGSDKETFLKEYNRHVKAAARAQLQKENKKKIEMEKKRQQQLKQAKRKAIESNAKASANVK